MTRLVQLVADEVPGDLTLSAATQHLMVSLPGATVQVTHVDPRDTLAAGFCIGQLALDHGPPDRVVVHHVATEDRQPLCVGRTHEGALVVGANVGWTWSFVVEGLGAMCCLDVPAVDERDALPTAIACVVARHPHTLRGAVPRESVPAVPGHAVAYVDAHGNLQTTLVQLPAAPGERVHVRVGEVAEVAVVAERRSEVADGQLVLRPGPFGWPTPSGTRRRFLELSVGGGSAAERFGRPASGARIAVVPARRAAVGG